MTPKTILVPTDLGDDESALEVATRIAEESGGRLVLLHVVEDPAEAVYGEKSTEGKDRAAWALWRHAKEDAEARLRTRMSEWHSEFDRYRPVCAFGDPAARIAETVAAEEVDLVVLSARRRPSLLGPRLGDVAYRVVRSVPCDVLVVD